MLSWCCFWYIVRSTSAIINSCIHPEWNILLVLRTDWDSPLWQSCAQYHSCTVTSYTINMNISCQMIHCSCYTSVHQPIFTIPCSLFAQNISVTEALCGDTQRSSWIIVASCLTCSRFPYLSLFLLQCLASIPFHAVILGIFGASAKCKSARKPHANLPDTAFNLTSESKYFQMLPGPPWAKERALRLCKSIPWCSWKLRQIWRCIQDATRFDLKDSHMLEQRRASVQVCGRRRERLRPLHSSAGDLVPHSRSRGS